MLAQRPGALVGGVAAAGRRAGGLRGARRGAAGVPALRAVRRADGVPRAQRRGARLRQRHRRASSPPGSPTLGGNERANVNLAPNYSEENAFFGWSLSLLAVGIVLWLRRERDGPGARRRPGVFFAVLSLGERVSWWDRDLVHRPVGAAGPAAAARRGGADPVRPDHHRGDRGAAGAGRGAGLGAAAAGAAHGPDLAVAGLVLALLPIAPMPLQVTSRPPVPEFITSDRWREYVGAGPDPGAGARCRAWATPTHALGGVAPTWTSRSPAATSSPRATATPATRAGSAAGPAASASCWRRWPPPAGRRSWTTGSAAAAWTSCGTGGRRSWCCRCDQQNAEPLRRTVEQLVGPARRELDVWVWDVRALTDRSAERVAPQPRRDRSGPAGPRAPSPPAGRRPPWRGCADARAWSPATSLLAVLLTAGQWRRPERLFHQAGDQMLFEWMLARAARAVTGAGEPAAQHRAERPGRGQPDGQHLGARAGRAADPGDPAARLPGRLPGGRGRARLAGTATAWYLLLSRRLVRSRVAAAVGGLFCGFAPGMISQAGAHLHMTAQFLVPVILGAGVPARHRPGTSGRGAARAAGGVPGLPRRGGAGLPGARRRAVRRRVRAGRPGGGPAAGARLPRPAGRRALVARGAAGVPAVVPVLRPRPLPRACRSTPQGYRLDLASFTASARQTVARRRPLRRRCCRRTRPRRTPSSGRSCRCSPCSW